MVSNKQKNVDISLEQEIIPSEEIEQDTFLEGVDPFEFNEEGDVENVEFD